MGSYILPSWVKHAATTWNPNAESFSTVLKPNPESHPNDFVQISSTMSVVVVMLCYKLQVLPVTTTINLLWSSFNFFLLLAYKYTDSKNAIKRTIGETGIDKGVENMIIGEKIHCGWRKLSLCINEGWCWPIWWKYPPNLFLPYPTLWCPASLCSFPLYWRYWIAVCPHSVEWDIAEYDWSLLEVSIRCYMRSRFPWMRQYILR